MSGTQAFLAFLPVLALTMLAGMGVMFRQTLGETAALMAERSGSHDASTYRARLQPPWLLPVETGAWVAILVTAILLRNGYVILLTAEACMLASILPKGVGVILRPHFCQDFFLDLALRSMLRRKAAAERRGEDADIRGLADAIAALALARKPFDFEPWRRQSFEQ